MKSPNIRSYTVYIYGSGQPYKYNKCRVQGQPFLDERVSFRGTACNKDIGGACYMEIGGVRYIDIGGACYKDIVGACYMDIVGACYKDIGGACYKDIGGACYMDIVGAKNTGKKAFREGASAP